VQSLLRTSRIEIVHLPSAEALTFIATPLLHTNARALLRLSILCTRSLGAVLYLSGNFFSAKTSSKLINSTPSPMSVTTSLTTMFRHDSFWLHQREKIYNPSQAKPNQTKPNQTKPIRRTSRRWISGRAHSTENNHTLIAPMERMSYGCNQSADIPFAASW
jgi:hypothetical protein